MNQSPPCPSVLITGASTGIGAACALRLDAEGYTVFAGVRNERDGEALRKRASDRLTPILIDVTREDQIAGAADRIAQAVQDRGLDGLVNNAGIAVAGPLEFVPVPDLRRQLEVNVIGLVAVTQAVLPLLRAARGRIVNIGSSSGRMAAPFMGPYSASKFGVEAISDAWRGELKPWGIEVALVEPGAIATPIWEKSRAAGETLRQQMPEECMRFYGEALDTLIGIVDKIARNAIPPEKVAAAVHHALTARRPKTRYLVGMDAHLQAWVGGFVPDRLRDWLILRVFANLI